MQVVLDATRTEVDIAIDGAPATVLQTRPEKERQVQRVLKSFSRHPVAAGRLPFSGLVVSEPKAPKAELPYPDKKKTTKGRKPDFLCLDDGEIAVVEVKLSYGKPAVRQLVNELVRVERACSDVAPGREQLTFLHKRIARTDPSMYGGAAIRGAVERSLDPGLAEAALTGWLITCDPERPGDDRVRIWLDGDGSVPLWAVVKPDSDAIVDKAETPAPRATFDLLAASFLRCVDSSNDVVLDLVALWDPRQVWRSKRDRYMDTGWPRGSLDIEIDSPDSLRVNSPVPSSLVGLAAQWSDTSRALYSATWAAP